jgi:hypothetical protein
MEGTSKRLPWLRAYLFDVVLDYTLQIIRKGYSTILEKNKQ